MEIRNECKNNTENGVWLGAVANHSLKPKKMDENQMPYSGEM